ncbi:MAG: ATP-binding protein [Bacteroidales bacterium]
MKVAIYDDMVEITSPGLLPQSIDYAAMESRQSDARNKVIAPVFKRLGIIDQWGNGLKLIADKMIEYPNIELRWREVGLSFQVQFVKRDYIPTQKEDVGINSDLLSLVRQNNRISAKELAEALGISSRQCERIIAELKKNGILERKGSKKTGYWEIKE